MRILRKELMKKYLEFFKSKDHKEIQNSSLIPENDPTVLFTTAGMHPLVPYLLGRPHPQGKRLVNIQRCIRTQDIEEVGDSYHHTFFEMLGNWSLGDYFKKDAIKFTFEFLTKKLKIPIEKLAVTCFKGNKNAPKDTVSSKIWKSLGISEERIAFLEDNWWETPGPGPCGPDTEIFYWRLNTPAPKKFNPKDSNWVEIGNNVLMQYEKDKNKNYLPAKQKNIDFGGGLDRTLTILNSLEDDYLSEIFQPIIKKIEKMSKKQYTDNPETTKIMRIIADHLKASVFILADGIIPSNTEQGYVLRRLIRRTVRYGRKINLENFTKDIAEPIFNIYKDYKILEKNKTQILNELELEEKKFSETLEKGLKIFDKLTKNKKHLNGKEIFLLYQSYGFPLEITKDLCLERNIKINEKEFFKEQEKHQNLSRTATQGKFKSGLANNSETTTKLHTATHLLNQALREVLKNPNIHQKGSNITPERLRFDFNFQRKLTSEELTKIENLVNQKIQENLKITSEKMTPQQAKTSGAQGVFDNKYSELITVYSIGNFSKEICAGPHVKNTRVLGRFKILKEESSARGIRRIKATLE